MSVVHRAQQRLALIITAMAHHGTCGQEFAKKLIAVLETGRGHAAGWTHAVGRLVRERDVERSIFAAEKPSGGESLQFLAFAVVEALADIDECGHGRIEWSERARDDGAQMRARHRL